MNIQGVKSCGVAVLFLLSAILPVAGQRYFLDRYICHEIDVNDGLPCSFVDDILFDSDGFLWIATSGGGLCRYDGHELIVLNRFSQPALKSNFIRSLAEDKWHRLWIASEGGLDILDLNTLEIDAHPAAFSITEQRACCSHVTVAADGAVWTKFANTLYRLEFSPDGISADIRSLTRDGFLPVNHTFKDADQDGTVWTLIGDRLWKVGPGTDKDSLKVMPAAPSLIFPENTYVSDFANLDSGFWISTEGGLFRLNKATGEWKHYVNDPSDPHSLTQNFVTSITFSPEGEMLVSTLRGLNVYNPVADNFERVGDDIINCTRSHGRDWVVATENKGLKIFSPGQLSVFNFSHDGNVPHSLAPGAVNAICQHSDGRLWIGSVEGGLSIRDENRKGGFRHLTKEKDGLCHNSVSALAEGPAGRMFTGTWGGGIDLVSAGERPHVIYHLPPPAGFSADYIGALAYDRTNGLLWVGTSQDILIWDPSGRSWQRVTNAPATGCLGSRIDASGHLWMGCTEGVYLFDLNARDDEGCFPAKLYSRQDGEHPILIKKICCIIEETDSTFFLGSNGGGLLRAVRQSDGNLHFTALTSQHGLSNDSVRGLCRDKEGNIWASTENGLNRLMAGTESVTSFFREDGLASNRFHWNNACTGSDGRLYFGHENGYSEIHPEAPRTSHSERIHLLFTRISRQGQEAVRTPHPETLRLHERDRNIRLQFSALTANAGLGVTYRYKMEGFDEDWITLPRGQREAIYTHLPGGSYIFKVRASDRFGQNIDELSLKVTVKPWFYHTVPFALLLMFAFCAAAYGWFVYRLRALRRSRRELSKAVEERTRALRETNEILKRQNEELASRKFLLSAENTREEKEGKFIEKVVETLRQMYKDPDLDIETFCRAMGMSKTLLNSRMQEALGQSTAQFIRTFRLSVAKEMLESDNQMNISEVAYEVGFNDPKYFTRCYAKEFGITPSEALRKN